MAKAIRLPFMLTLAEVTMVNLSQIPARPRLPLQATMIFLATSKALYNLEQLSCSCFFLSSYTLHCLTTAISLLSQHIIIAPHNRSDISTDRDRPPKLRIRIQPYKQERLISDRISNRYPKQLPSSNKRSTVLSSNSETTSRPYLRRLVVSRELQLDDRIVSKVVGPSNLSYETRRNELLQPETPTGSAAL